MKYPYIKNKKKYLHAVFFLMILAGAMALLNFLLLPLSSLQKKFISYHSVRGNIDFIVIGSSLEGDGVSGSVIKNETGMNAFVFSPQGGFPETSYYLLLDVLNRNTVKTAVIGWDMIQNLQFPEYVYPHREELYRELLPDSRKNPLLRKIVLKGVADQKYTMTFFEFASFPENITDIAAVLKSRNPKMLTETKELPPPIDITRLKENTDFNYAKLMDRSYTDKIKDDDIFYLKKIKDVCAEHNIDLYVLCAPLPDCIITTLPILPRMQAVSKQLFRKLNIQYIDGFDQHFFPGSTADTNFKDCFGHIISPYREKYTKSICDNIKAYKQNMESK